MHMTSSDFFNIPPLRKKERNRERNIDICYSFDIFFVFNSSKIN